MSTVTYKPCRQSDSLQLLIHTHDTAVTKDFHFPLPLFVIHVEGDGALSKRLDYRDMETDKQRGEWKGCIDDKYVYCSYYHLTINIHDLHLTSLIELHANRCVKLYLLFTRIGKREMRGVAYV